MRAEKKRLLKASAPPLTLRFLSIVAVYLLLAGRATWRARAAVWFRLFRAAGAAADTDLFRVSVRVAAFCAILLLWRATAR
jgi:hypothetical protein